MRNYRFVLEPIIVMFSILIILLIDNNALAEPLFNDLTLKYEIIAEGLMNPTGIVFINNDILIAEKEGNIRLLTNQQLDEKPIHEFSVNTKSERGLLGIETDGSNIFVYLTEITNDDSLRNRVYKFLWNGNELTNQQLLLDLPALPGPNHDGGKLVLEKSNKSDNNNNLYVVIGDLNHRGILQNINSNDKPDDTGVIFRINSKDGSAIETNPFYSNSDTSKYFAYGIRNSFGITIDPLTGTLWQTENGPSEYDEINIVKPGFNSGWVQIMGPISRSDNSLNDLQVISNSSYSDPQLSWKDPVALTDIEFLNSSKLGQQYLYKMIVGDYNEGNLYILSLNEKRDNILLDTTNKDLLDKVIDEDQEDDSIMFGTGFGSITDLEIGPDGFLYVLSFNDGILYKIYK
ncbi:MAG TPA: PQQ-dependent sugar dehydrogenase [Nitrososphaeraceae archaeon]|nr:PQQ-dependent sugar dehydrogenase [Nitrososphaeraceae archaeon]